MFYPYFMGRGTKTKNSTPKNKRENMKKVLSVSVHAIPESDKVRAILWSGRVVKTEEMLMVAESTHQNIFRSLRGLKGAMIDWSTRNSKIYIVGLSDLEICWPISPDVLFLYKEQFSESMTLLQYLVMTTERHRTHAGGFKGLHCLIFPTEDQGRGRMQLYDVMPMPKEGEVERAQISHIFLAPNLFSAAEDLCQTVRAATLRRGISKVPGLFDKSPVWPEGLGEFRFS